MNPVYELRIQAWLGSNQESSVVNRTTDYSLAKKQLRVLCSAEPSAQLVSKEDTLLTCTQLESLSPPLQYHLYKH